MAKLFDKILIANRGEIAIRVIKACRELGIKTIAIYSDADKDAMHVRLADEAYHIGPPPPLKSYLNIEKIVEVIERSKADAVHPGYGFLSENAKAAEAFEKAGAVWIGPSPQVMDRVSSKCYTRRAANEAGVPVIPGTLNPVKDADEVVELLEKYGPPLLIKPDLGGGGKGVRLVKTPEEAREAFEGASREALAYFGNPNIYVEKRLDRPRHIEVQILADKHGNVIHLGERECSIQRRYQKVVEESPSPVVDEKTRSHIAEMAIKVARQVGYVNAGTMEFLRDREGNFYFMEINKRLQVEHPVTEMVTGVDIVKCQIMIAAGEPLPYKQEDIKISGHSIEARIYAEDPETLLPSPGKITELKIPEGENIRVDHALEVGGTVSLYYDPLIAKLVVWGKTRSEAIETMRKALDEFVIGGIKTSISLHKEIFSHPTFISGEFDNTTLETVIKPQLAKGIDLTKLFKKS
ncbi:MAG: acetyl-CoA carboxylase biotin carboxylase subunit [Candidatus Hecatellaceae archaeon]